ncbi:MAG: chaperonin GroEL [Methanobrevibacter sp.]|nr:chaperonin GroEL [Methanobrevibacter sp.]
MAEIFKDIKFHSDARMKMKEGIDILAEAVKSTLGPKGKNVIIGGINSPHVTKDGVTVAKEINLKDPFQNIGAQLIKEVASKTCVEAGDGTTTSTVLIQAIIDEGLKEIELGTDPVLLQHQIEETSDVIVGYIQNSSQVIEGDSLKNVAIISTNNDVELGTMIAETFDKVTENGVIVVEESKNVDTTVEIISGMQFDRGYLAPHFITDQIRNEAVLENPYILITDQKIESTRELVGILNEIVSERASILLIAEDFDSEVIENLKVNKLQNILKVVPIKAPSFGEYRKEVLYDLAILTHGVYVGYDSGLTFADIDLSALGRAEKIVVTKDTTTIIGGKGKKSDLEVRVTQIKQQLDALKTSQNDVSFMKDFLQNRIAKLTGGVAIIHVGGTTELEMKQRKDRVDDAVAATRAAIEEGVVIGGGMTYLQLSDMLVGNVPGERVIKQALLAPFKQILRNIGYSEPKIEAMHNKLTELHKTGLRYGFNAKTERVEDLFEAGVIDPAKVSRLAFVNAVSVATLFLTTECIIVPEIQNQLITF